MKGLIYAYCFFLASTWSVGCLNWVLDVLDELKDWLIDSFIHSFIHIHSVIQSFSHSLKKQVGINCIASPVFSLLQIGANVNIADIFKASLLFIQQWQNSWNSQHKKHYLWNLYCMPIQIYKSKKISLSHFKCKEVNVKPWLGGCNPKCKHWSDTVTQL